jgi:hypothetical protein
MDRDDHDQRAARINAMLEELRLNTEDLHELAKQATDRSWEGIRAARIEADGVRAQSDSQPTKKMREP